MVIWVMSVQSWIKTYFLDGVDVQRHDRDGRWEIIEPMLLKYSLNRGLVPDSLKPPKNF